MLVFLLSHPVDYRGIGGKTPHRKLENGTQIHPALKNGLQMSTDENGNEARHGMTYSGIDGSNTGKKTDDDNNKPEQKLLFFCQNN
jgi:hypothetical protein